MCPNLICHNIAKPSMHTFTHRIMGTRFYFIIKSVQQRQFIKKKIIDENLTTHANCNFLIFKSDFIFVNSQLAHRDDAPPRSWSKENIGEI